MLNAEGMADAIFSKMELTYWADTPLKGDAEAETKKYYKVISEAIIEYLKANTEVVPGTLTSSSSGGPLSGTGKLQ